jgi:hypothetical protein
LLTFKGYLNEGFVNLINDNPKKSEYIDAVWDMIQKSYAPIGGIKSNGFQTKEAMMKVPFWKIGTVNGKPVAVTFYKDKNGRKSVASGTDGSDDGKKRIIDMMKNELKRSYGEKSKASLGLMLKITPPDVVKQFLITPKDVQAIDPKDKIVPIKGYKGDLPKDAKLTLEKYPYLKDYGYLRDFGGTMLFKVMMGTPGKIIK